MNRSTGRAGVLVRRLALAALSAVVGLKLADVALGVADPFGISHFSNNRIFDRTCMRSVPPHNQYREPIPGSSVDAGVHYRINALGLRGPETTAEKPPGTYRVLLLGDSVCFGWGVDEERTLGPRLQDMLDAEDPARRHEVLNLAVIGHHTVMQFDRFTRIGLALHPDLVLYVFNQNDVEIFAEEIARVESAIRERFSDPAPLTRMFLDSGADRIARWAFPNLRNLIIYRSLFRLQPDDERELYQLYTGFTLGIEQNLKSFGELAALGRQHGFRFAVLDPYDFTPLKDGLEKHGIPYASINYSKDAPASALRNSPADPHPNARGHELMAQKSLHALHALKLLPGDADGDGH